MLQQIEVQLRNGTLALCQVVEVGIKTVAKFKGREFEIERNLGAWRERAAAQPGCRSAFWPSCNYPNCPCFGEQH